MTAPILAQFDVLSDANQRTLNDHLARIRQHSRRNRLLSDYYEGKKQVRSLGIAVSPEFDALETVVGWPGTVVDARNERRVIDHLIVPSSADQTDILADVWEYNDMQSEAPMAHDDESIHGVTFVVVARDGDRTLILPTPASRMTMDYDRAKRRGVSAASIDPPARRGDKVQYTLYTLERTYVVERGTAGRFNVVNAFDNPSGVLPVERLVNRPRHERPWGRSQITPAVISYTDAAVRTLVSMEVSREFFAAPMRYALDIDADAFTDENGQPIPAWETYWGKFIALAAAETEDGTGRAPTLGQLPASSPAPMTELMRMLSQMMTAETRMPPSLWGFVTDNPASGDGARMYENGLVLSAKAANRSDGAAWSRISRLVLLAEGTALDSLPKVDTLWHDPATFTPGSITDSVMKQVEGGVLPRESDVTLEQLGYDRPKVDRIQQDRRSARAVAIVNGLSQLDQGAVSADTGAAATVPSG